MRITCALSAGVVGTALLLGLGGPCCAQAKSRSGCLAYEPDVVKLEGKLITGTFPGPPNYESIRKGDKAETYWLLDLSTPICVDQDQKDPDLNAAQKDVRRVQLVIKPEFYKTNAALVGKQVLATGTLFAGITGHHHTPVLLTVTTLTEK